MKRTPLKRKTQLRAKHTFKRSKMPIGALKVLKGSKPRKKASNLSKLKNKLWKLCREIQIKRYGSDCYTCPSKNLSGSSRHLGHFIPSSVCSTEMRYSLDNLRVQCYACNIHKSGNWIEYEKHLIRDGIDVQELKDRNERTKGQMYRTDWYEQKIAEYSVILDNLV